MRDLRGYAIKDRYDVLELLGRGGGGIVYKAHDRELGRDVAIKFRQAAEADDLARFQREAQLVARLSHPSIAAVGRSNPTQMTRFRRRMSSYSSAVIGHEQSS